MIRLRPTTYLVVYQHLLVNCPVTRAGTYSTAVLILTRPAGPYGVLASLGSLRALTPPRASASRSAGPICLLVSSMTGYGLIPPAALSDYPIRLVLAPTVLHTGIKTSNLSRMVNSNTIAITAG